MEYFFISGGIVYPFYQIWAISPAVECTDGSLETDSVNTSTFSSESEDS